MTSEFSYLQVVRHEYENRGNGRRCFVTNITDDGIVEYCIISGSSYKQSKYAKYADFKRAWVNRGIHLPFVGRIYKSINSPNFYLFVTKIIQDSSKDFYVLAENLSKDKQLEQLSIIAFHSRYELCQ